MKLREIYNELKVDANFNESSKSYNVRLLDHDDQIFIGHSSKGEPAILLKSEDADELIENIKDLTGVKAEFYTSCTIDIEGEVQEKDKFNAVTCTRDEEVLKDFFFNFFEGFFQREKNITGRMLEEELKNISQLFSYRKKKGRQSMMGLWSELFILNRVQNTEVWVEKWHEYPRSTFDYTFSNIGVDAKSFSTNQREHYFKIEQLNNQSVEQCLVLSMALSEDELGKNIIELFDEIKNKINSKILIDKISKQVFKGAGDKIDDAKRYNTNIAEKSLCILKSEDIPKIETINVPEGVTDVKFKSDCSSVTTIDFDSENQKKIEKGEII